MSMARLLDEIAPKYDVQSRHEITVHAPAAAVAAALERYSPESSPVIRALMLARGIRFRVGAIREFTASGPFAILAERPGAEIVLGVAGRFWALHETANLYRIESIEAFRASRAPAKAALAIEIQSLDDGVTRLATETRVVCDGAASRRRFRLYWYVVGPFSGVIRREFLRGVARIAES